MKKKVIFIYFCNVGECGGESHLSDLNCNELSNKIRDVDMIICRYFSDNPDDRAVNEANHVVGDQAGENGASDEREVVPLHEIQAPDRVYGGRDLALRDQVRQKFPNL